MNRNSKKMLKLAVSIDCIGRVYDIFSGCRHEHGKKYRPADRTTSRTASRTANGGTGDDKRQA